MSKCAVRRSVSFRCKVESVSVWQTGRYSLHGGGIGISVRQHTLHAIRVAVSLLETLATLCKVGGTVCCIINSHECAAQMLYGVSWV